MQLHRGSGKEPIHGRGIEGKFCRQLAGERLLLTGFQLREPELRLVGSLQRRLTQPVQRLR